MDFSTREAPPRKLLRIIRSEAALRLALGEGVLALEKAGGWKSLGYSTLENYARERLGRSGRWISDARALARRINFSPDFLPLRDAVLSGRLSISKVEIVWKLLSGLTQQPVAQVVEAARFLTVKQLRSLARYLEGKPEQPHAEDSGRTWETLVRHIDPVDLMAFEYVVKLITGVSNLPTGDVSRAQAVEYMLAEAMTTLMRFSKVDLPSLAPRAPDTSCDSDSPSPTFDPQQKLDLRPSDEPDPDPCLETDIVWTADLDQIDAQLQSLSSALATRDLDIGILGRECCAMKVHIDAGYDNFDDYCKDVLQYPPASMASRVALVGRLNRLKPIEDALVDGRIGYEAASLIARISHPQNPDDAYHWVERAEHLTLKQLREEIDTARLFSRVNDDAPHPPTRTEMREAADFERTVYSTLIGRTAPEPTPEPPPRAEDHGGRKSGGEASTENLPLRLSLPTDLAVFWRELETEHRTHVGGDFIPFLIRSVLSTWQDAFSHLSKIEYSDVYERDRWRCQNPCCTNRNVTPHHIVFRSAGGGEDRSNLVSLCATCHLELVHGKTARGSTLHVSGQAPDDLSWTTRPNNVTQEAPTS
jgi:hypothetical protein